MHAHPARGGIFAEVRIAPELTIITTATAAIENSFFVAISLARQCKKSYFNWFAPALGNATPTFIAAPN